MTNIRPTAVAGSFYPSDAASLCQQIDEYLAAIPDESPAAIPPKAVIAPHAGYVYSGPVAASVYARLRPLRGVIRRVVLLGPSHRVGFRGMAFGQAEAWASPLGTVPVDRAALDSIRLLPMVGELDAAHAQEHSLEVHIPFLQRVLGDFALIPIVVGDATAEEVAALLNALWGGLETLIVVSTDLSHYLPYESCQQTDARTVAAIERLDGAALQRDDACGRLPVSGLLLAAQRHHLRIETVDVRNSGDIAGSRDRVVGYGAWALYEEKMPAPLSATELSLRAVAPALLDLARTSIRHGVQHRAPVGVNLTPGIPAVLRDAGAAFVTLKKQGQLRGCIGSVIGHRPLAQDVADNAFKAAFRDPRFPPLTADELEQVTLSVSVLTAPEPLPVRDQADLLSKLRPGVDGLIIEDQGMRALFLPSVWEQLPDPAQFLGHLKLKAGMGVDHWSPTFQCSIFHAVELKA